MLLEDLLASWHESAGVTNLELSPRVMVLLHSALHAQRMDPSCAATADLLRRTRHYLGPLAVAVEIGDQETLQLLLETEGRCRPLKLLQRHLFVLAAVAQEADQRRGGAYAELRPLVEQIRLLLPPSLQELLTLALAEGAPPDLRDPPPGPPRFCPGCGFLGLSVVPCGDRGRGLSACCSGCGWTGGICPDRPGGTAHDPDSQCFVCRLPSTSSELCGRCLHNLVAVHEAQPELPASEVVSAARSRLVQDLAPKSARVPT